MWEWPLVLCCIFWLLSQQLVSALTLSFQHTLNLLVCLNVQIKQYPRMLWTPLTKCLQNCNFCFRLLNNAKESFPSRIDMTSRKLIFWEFYTHNSVISATTFIKNGPNFAPPCLFQEPHLSKSRNQVVQLPTTLIWATRLLKINIKVWK